MTIAQQTNETTVATPAPARRVRLLPALLVVAAFLAGILAGFLVGPVFDNDRTRVPLAGSVDVGFAQDMAVRDSQAVELTTAAIMNAADPAVRTMAYDILTARQHQIGELQGWLVMWGQPTLPADGYMAWMPSDNHAEESMPGMATSEERSSLRQARGPAFDVLFLQLLQRNFQGGLAMLQYAGDHADTPVVRQLAQSMAAKQAGQAQLIAHMLTDHSA
jgi:uncharacterized protein (DUF305 family)